jgi:steroid delta-isomerase-like uncharacterized protein
MSAAPAEIARRWFEDVWNRRQEAAIDRLLAPHSIAHGLPTPNGESLVGPAAFKALFHQFTAAFPDIHVEVVRTVAEGDLVAAHCHVTGTHRGAELGLDPTGRGVDFWGVAIFRVSDGVIQEGWNSFDFLTMNQQIGAISL